MELFHGDDSFTLLQHTSGIGRPVAAAGGDTTDRLGGDTTTAPTAPYSFAVPRVVRGRWWATLLLLVWWSL